MKELTVHNLNRGPGYRDTNEYRYAATISSLKILHSVGTAYRWAAERRRQRKRLLEMDDRELNDIGITREQAEREARKPVGGRGGSRKK
jgi:uncharacterized protein YjiS (DUF1127 family)